MQAAQLDGAGAGLGLHVAFAGALLGKDVAGAGVQRESAMEAGGVNAARAGGELGGVAHAVISNVA